MPLSDRIRPNTEAAPWVVEEVKTLEAELAAAKAQNEAIARILLADKPNQAAARHWAAGIVATIERGGNVSAEARGK